MNADDEVLWEQEGSSLSEAQDKTLSLIPGFSGLLSAWGSASIIYMFYKTSAAKRNCYKRIMLGLSCSDFLSSLTLSLQAFLLPSETSNRIWASGTATTCHAMGFFQQLAFSAIWYNGMLSFMFLLTIKYSVGEQDLVRKFEPWMHVLSIGFPLISATIGAALGMYAELVVGHFCWFTGDNTTIYAFIVSGGPGFFFLLAIPINNMLVYRHVRHTIHNDLNSSEDGQLCQTSSEGSNKSGESAFSNEQIREELREKQKQRSMEDRQKERIQAVAFQSFLYVASFMITHLPTMIIRVTSAVAKLHPSDEEKFFPLLLVQAILLPLQGLFNYIIYCRPSYLREAAG